MPTKTEYRAYIASEAWQERRRQFLKGAHECEHCYIPRWLAIIAYDQDLHIHHKSYANVGHELDSDLQPLCRRCHEIKTFGESKLHKPQSYECIHCGETTYNISRRCSYCDAMFDFVICNIDHRHLTNQKLCPNGEPWEWILNTISGEIHRGTYFKYLEAEYLREKAEKDANPDEYDDSGWMPPEK